MTILVCIRCSKCTGLVSRRPPRSGSQSPLIRQKNIYLSGREEEEKGGRKGGKGAVQRRKKKRGKRGAKEDQKMKMKWGPKEENRTKRDQSGRQESKHQVRDEMKENRRIKQPEREKWLIDWVVDNGLMDWWTDKERPKRERKANNHAHSSWVWWGGEGTKARSK